MRAKSETWLAVSSAAIGVLNFLGESFAQLTSTFYITHVPYLVMSLAGAVLLMGAGARSLLLRPRTAAGPLAGAWGFFFGTYLATQISNLEEWWPASAALSGTPPPGLIIANLPLMAVAALLFVWALVLALRQSSHQPTER